MAKEEPLWIDGFDAELLYPGEVAEVMCDDEIRLCLDGKFQNQVVLGIPEGRPPQVVNLAVGE